MSSLGTLSLDFLVKLNNSMQQIQNLESKINGLEQKAQKTQQQLNKLNNVKLGNMANQFDSARGSIDKFKGSLGSVVSGKGGMGDLVGAFKGIPPQALVAAAGVAAVSAAVIGLGAAIQKSLSFTQSYGDEMAKNSQKAGVAVEAYQEMRHAADMSGVSAGELDKTFKHINKTLGDSENAKNKSVQGFKSLGISLKDANGNLKSADQILQETAGAMQGIKGDTEKAALALELFGKDGAALMPMLNSGEEGIKAMREEANRLGIVMGADAAKQAEAYGDSISRLGKFFDGLKISIGTIFMPAATLVLDVLLEIGMAFKDVLPEGESFKDLVLDITKQGLRLLIDAIQTTLKRVESFGKLIEGTAPILGMLAQNVMNNVQAVRALINMLGVFQNIVQGSVLFVFGQLIKATGSFLSTLGRAAESVPGLESMAASLRGAGQEAKTAGEAVAQFSSTSFKAAKTDALDVNDALGQISLNSSKASENIAGVGQSLQKAGKVAENLSKASGLLGNIGKGGTFKLETSDKTQKTLESIDKHIQAGNKSRDKKDKPGLENLSTPALFEKLTGGKFPENLVSDPKAIKSTEEFNKRRQKALEDLNKREQQINAQFKRQQAAIDASIKGQQNANLLQQKNNDQQENIGKKQTELVKSAQTKVEAEDSLAFLQKDNKEKLVEQNKNQDELNKAIKFNADQQMVLSVGLGGIGGGSSGIAAQKSIEKAMNTLIPSTLANTAKGRLVNSVKQMYGSFEEAIATTRVGSGVGSKIIDKVMKTLEKPQLAKVARGEAGPPGAVFSDGGQVFAQGKATKQVIGAGVGTAGAAAGAGVGKVIADFMGETRIKQLEDEKSKLESIIFLNKVAQEEEQEKIKEATAAGKEHEANQQKLVELKIQEAQIQSEIAMNQEAINQSTVKAGKLQQANGIARAQYDAQVAAINVEQIAVQMALNSASEKKRQIDEAIARILELRTEMANNELTLGEDAARFANTKLQNEIKILEIGLQDVSVAERKVLLLEQQASHQTSINGMLNDAVQKAREGAELAAKTALEIANREETAKRELLLLRTKSEIEKAGLELSFKMQDLQNQKLTLAERELEEKKALLEYEKAITEEKKKQLEATSQIIGGAGSIGGQFAGIMEKLGFDKETARIVDEISVGLGGVAQGVTGIGQIMAGDVIGGTISLVQGLISTFESIFDIFNPPEEEIDKSEYTQLVIDQESIRQQAREFARAFVDEQERRMSRPIQITVDARGALIGEENEVARQLGNLLENEMGRRIGNVNVPRGF